jgi:hypothetical protein
MIGHGNPPDHWLVVEEKGSAALSKEACDDLLAVGKIKAIPAAWLEGVVCVCRRLL